MTPIVPPQTNTRRMLDYQNICLFAIIMSSALVGVPLFGHFYGYSWLDWTLFGVMYVVTGLGITVGYHRLLTHQSFSVPAGVRIYFLVTGGWAFENSALAWCSDHLRHHTKVDTAEDPYNAKLGFWHSHVTWLLHRDPYRTEKYRTPFLKDKWIVWQHRYYFLIVLMGWAIPAGIGYLHRGTIGAFSAFFLAVIFRTFMVLNSTFCINSLCHLWGKQSYGTSHTGRDSWWVSLITFGEGYHNYHHTFPRDYRNGTKWYNFDPSKWLIFSLSKVGATGGLIRMTPPGGS